MDQFLPKVASLSKISLILIIVLSFTTQFGAAIRPILYEEQLLKKVAPNLESLQKGPVSPSGHSGCSNIPHPGKCEINEMNFAGRLSRSPPPFSASKSDERFVAAATSMENKSDN
ncbi:hypothetical protein DITRI_Ditri15bG0092900 [Diplodiscus trichospermus]